MEDWQRRVLQVQVQVDSEHAKGCRALFSTQGFTK